MEKELTPWELSQEEALDLKVKRMRQLIRRNWILNAGDMWEHPLHVDNKRRLLFTFDQAVKAEGL